MTPFKLLAWAFNALMGHIAMTIIRLEIHHLWNPDWTWALPKPQDPNYVGENHYYYEGYVDEGYDEVANGQIHENGIVTDADDEAQVEIDEEDREREPYDEMADEYLKEFTGKQGGPIPLLDMTYIKKTQPKPCDQEVYLYELNETVLYEKRPLQGILSNCHTSECKRPFAVSMIPNTNLVLVVADKTCPCFSNKISVKPTKVDYGPKNETEASYCSLLKTNLYRKKPTDIVNYHPQEDEISLCGGSSQLTLSILLLISLIFLPQL